MAKHNNVMNEIKLWRMNAGLSQVAMSNLLNIPKHTIEEWDMGHFEPTPWAKQLLIDKLQQIAGRHIASLVYNEAMNKYPNESFHIKFIVNGDISACTFFDLSSAILKAHPGDEIRCVAIGNEQFFAEKQVRWEV